MFTVSLFFTVWIFRTVSKAELKSQMNGGHPAVSQTVQRDRKGKTHRERGEFSLLSEPPPRLISAGWWLKQPLQLTKLPFPCQYEILCLTATHSPKALLPHNAGVKSYRAWRRRRWYDGCSRGEEKGPLIEQALAIFCRPETAVLLLWDTEWDEDIRGERGQAEVLKCR